MFRMTEELNFGIEQTPTERLINLLTREESFVSPFDHKEYTLKMRLMGADPVWNIFNHHCHERMLIIKQISFPKDDEDNEKMLNCTYYFCPKCGDSFYDDGR